MAPGSRKGLNRIPIVIHPTKKARGRCVLHGTESKDSSVQRRKPTGAHSVSEHDALSGLLNRSGFNVRVRMMIDAHPDEAYLLVYGDIDRFKAYNDLFGLRR